MSHILDFAAPGSVVGWHAIDDRVMGGQSSSILRHDAQGHAVFCGTVSLADQGGFASVRSPLLAMTSNAEFCRLTVRGDGKRYKLSFRKDTGFDGLNFQHVFEPPAGNWVEILLPLSAFVPGWRGRRLLAAPPGNASAIHQLGLLIGDRQAGDFRLEIRSIAFIDPAN